MKKSVIALAVAAAMPFAVQADTSITGSVTGKYYLSTDATGKSSKGLDIDADLDIFTTKVLTNGMTASASFDIMDHPKLGSGSCCTAQDKGKASLDTVDYGVVTIGYGLVSDAAFQSGDVAEVVDAATTADSSSAVEANAVHYSGNFYDVNLAVQLNAATKATGQRYNTQTASTQLGLSYEVMDNVTVGYSYTDADLVLTNLSGQANNGGANEATNAFGVKYVWEDLTVMAGKQDIADAIVQVKYIYDDITASYKMNTSSASDDKLVVSYSANDIDASLTYNQAKSGAGESQLELSASYTWGDLKTTFVRKHDESNDLTVAYDMGNADVTFMHDGSNSQNTLEYKVLF